MDALEARIRILDNKITTLRAERFSLEMERNAILFAQLGDNVGKCFKCGGKYARIIAAPKLNGSMPGLRYNPKQYPVIILNEEVIPFRLSTIPVEGYEKYWTEIPPEEFNQAFDTCAARLKVLAENGYRPEDDKGGVHDEMDGLLPRLQRKRDLGH